MKRSVVIKWLSYEASAGWTTYGTALAYFSLFQGVATRHECSSKIGLIGLIGLISPMSPINDVPRDFHQITTSAPLLIVTDGPTMMRDAPLPF
jgi:hypothetical protein